MPDASVIIPAAGRGERFVRAAPAGASPATKVLADLAGQPVLRHTLRRFLDVAAVRDVVVAAPKDRLDEVRAAVGDAGSGAVPVTVVAGGDDRLGSVAAALEATDGGTEVVVVHDAVRPLIRPAVIEEAMRVAVESGAAVVGRMVDHTVKRVGDRHMVLETVPRQGLWLAQTPQAFRREVIARAYARRGEVVGPVTDDAQLVEAMGFEVAMVAGDAANFKITTPEDLRMCAALVAAGWPFE